jgi:hypothetical protein
MKKKQIDEKTYGWMKDRQQTGRQKNTLTDRQKYKLTDRQADQIRVFLVYLG